MIKTRGKGRSKGREQGGTRVREQGSKGKVAWARKQSLARAKVDKASMSMIRP